jgi:hypothetical protein
MRLVVATEPGTVEVNFMWLPTWLGLDSQLKKDLENELGPLLVGKELTEEVLEQAHHQVVDFLVKRHGQFAGLRDYLDALKFVRPPEA